MKYTLDKIKLLNTIPGSLRRKLVKGSVINLAKKDQQLVETILNTEKISFVSSINSIGIVQILITSTLR